VTEVDELCRYGERLGHPRRPVGRPYLLAAPLRRLPGHQAHPAGTPLDRDSGAFRACRDALYATGEPLLTPCAGRPDGPAPRSPSTTLLRFFLGVTSAPVSSRRQRDRFLAMAIAGLCGPDRRPGRRPRLT